MDAKLAKLNVAPSGLCDDAEFLRRVYLDLTGTLPTPDEARKFLADTAKDKRAKLVESLLDRPGVRRPVGAALGRSASRRSPAARPPAGAPLLQVDSRFHRREQAIRPVRPRTRHGRRARRAKSGRSNFFKVVTKPGEMAGTVSQVFLGVRIACAECHHHPFDRWKQTDYYGMTAFFATGQRPLHAATRTQGSFRPRARHRDAGREPRPATAGCVLAEWMTKPG